MVVSRTSKRFLVSGLGFRFLRTLEANISDWVTVVEVGPRDGLQNEKAFIPTPVKIDFINRLTASGLPRIEVTSFVSPKWVPQMRDAAEVATGIKRRKGTVYSCLTPNTQGFEAAVKCGVDEVAIFAAASESFSQRNINCSIDESLDRFKKVTDRALGRGLPVRGYVSCVVGCPYEGKISPEQVRRTTVRMVDLGCYEVSLGDTIGVGNPESIDAMLEAVLRDVPAERLAIHCHDTYGRALNNIEAALARGIRVVDASVGGLGGCPYAGPGAPGNVATEAVVRRLHELGFKTGVDLGLLEAASKFIWTELEQLAPREPTPRL